jgi:hypothetical protein
MSLLLRPESPTQESLTDVEEDFEERRRRSLPPSGNTLLAPPPHVDEGGLTDTEVLSEDDQQEEEGGGGTSSGHPEYEENYSQFLRDHHDQGDISVQGGDGSVSTIISRKKTKHPEQEDDQQQQVTDVSEVEGEDYEPLEFHCQIASQSYTYQEEEDNHVSVSVTQKHSLSQKRYSLTEFLKVNEEEDGLTDVEDLDVEEYDIGDDEEEEAGSHLLRVLVTSPDPVTDEEELGESSGHHLLKIKKKRPITPSDCGDPPLYEDITDEEEEMDAEEGKKPSSLLLIGA